MSRDLVHGSSGPAQRVSPVRRCGPSVGLGAILAAGGAVLALGALPAAGAFPGRNGRIVFSSDRPAFDESADFEIYSMRPDGSDLLQLTDNALAPAAEGGEEGGEEGCGGGKGGAGGMSEGGSEEAQLEEGSEGAGEGGTGAEGAGGEAQPTPIDDVQPAVSPDGREIAFVSNRPSSEGGEHGESFSEIYVMKIDGSDVRQLTRASSFTSGPKAAYEPAWSPDGKQIVFRRGEGAKADLWVIDLATGRLTKLQTAYEKGPAGYDAQPSWSPSGGEIAFVKGFGRAADIWVYHVYGPRQGESLPVIHAVNVAETSPSWSPDGKLVAYARGDESAGAGIWVANADGTSQHALTQPLADAEGKAYSDLAPRFSPDGRQIVFESTRDGVPNPLDLSPGEGECKEGEEGEQTLTGAVELFEMNVDGADLHKLTTAASVEGPQDVQADWQTIPSLLPPPEVPSQQQLKAPVVEVPIVSEGPKRCVPLRSFAIAIRLSERDRRHMRYVHARVNRRRVKVRLAGRLVSVGVNAKRAVKGTLAVEVYVMLRHGRHLWGMRTFRRCEGTHLDGVETFHLQRHARHRHASVTRR